MSINEEHSGKLYSQAYNLHYNSGKLDVAYALYNRIIELYPDSEDANSAKFQINDIKKKYPDITPAHDEDSSVFSGTEQSTSSTGNQYSGYSSYQPKTVVDHGGNLWIAGMKIFAWIVFAGIIIAGIVMAFMSNSGGIGFLIFLISVILAFLSVATLMIFLNLAQDVLKIKQDISEVRDMLQNNKK